jgi:hypothetical protein
VTAMELLVDLQRQGFSLHSEGNGIRVAPVSKLTPEQRGMIRANKNELLRLLRARDTRADDFGTASPIPAPEADARPVWVLLPGGYPVKVFTSDRIPPEATAWCYEGDKAWQKISCKR